MVARRQRDGEEKLKREEKKEREKNWKITVSPGQSNDSQGSHESRY